jgi:hypothetical protein
MVDMIVLRALRRDDMPQILAWRSVNPEGARTPYQLTLEQQYKFYDEIVCNRDSPHRYWGVEEGGQLVGMVGITYIEWENRRGEVAILIDPQKRGGGYGKRALWLLLEQAFDRMGLASVYGNVYLCNPYLGWWGHWIGKYDWYTYYVPKAKWWSGKWEMALGFVVTSEHWEKMQDGNTLTHNG